MSTITAGFNGSLITTDIERTLWWLSQINLTGIIKWTFWAQVGKHSLLVRVMIMLLVSCSS